MKKMMIGRKRHKFEVNLGFIGRLYKHTHLPYT